MGKSTPKIPWSLLFAAALLVTGCALRPATATPTNTPVEPTATTPAPATRPPTPPNVAVAISPSGGPPGTEIEAVVTGFPPDTEIELGLGPTGSTPDLVVSSRADAEGTATATLAIPTTAETGQQWTVTVTTEDGAAQAVSNPFEVTPSHLQPQVTVSPTAGPPGTDVRVVAEGFPPNASVEIGVGRVSSEYDVVARARTDADGDVETWITIPTFVEIGDRWVIVVAAQDPALEAVSEEFDVTQVPTLTPSSTRLLTRTNIYLIAVGDAGESGDEIGCADSVVPVEVEVEPTLAPLTAALNRLLAIEGREYGESGLYNALHQSDLTLESVRIEDGEAVIRLSGTLVLGGVCDEPRVRAQLRRTALQYKTVDRVSIFIDGTPLDELLGGD